ncbi:hypothetical protein DSO57_1012487 [Entomophthora muscae]|uniref:Uncharacterized protein n=1 Tax=Entomophthora muscae TaxID=34485 RepID=A0ACC2SJD0_9FUNG|nr:hypothetical protein DSO57_1012487 [Entomophthora muscae]
MVLSLLIKGSRTVFYSTSLFGIACGLNALQIFTIPLWPFSGSLSYWINSTLAGCLWRVMQFIFEDVKGGRVTYSGDKLESDQSALVTCNHRSWSDFYMLNAVSSRLGMMPYNRYFVKDSLKHIPFFGWGMYLMGMLMVRRSWDSDQKKIDRVFSDLVDNKRPVWLISFIEGSRYTTEKCLEAQEFCRSRNLPVLEHVLFPRTKGIMASISKLRHSHVKYLYDFTIAYQQEGKPFGKAPNLIDIHTVDHLSPPYHFHMHIEKHRLEDLPTNPAELNKWIIQLYQRKDTLLSQLAEKGWTANLDPCLNLRPTP